MNKYKIYFYCLLTAVIVWIFAWAFFTLPKTGRILYIGPDESKFEEAFIGILTNQYRLIVTDTDAPDNSLHGSLLRENITGSVGEYKRKEKK